jgi:Holliday junction resolvase RusA-like endonuclease
MPGASPDAQAKNPIKVFLAPAARAWKKLCVFPLRSSVAHIDRDTRKTWTTKQCTFRVLVVLSPPDYRIRDVDNIPKICLDAITASRAIWDDDHQVIACTSEMAPVWQPEMPNVPSKLARKHYGKIDVIITWTIQEEGHALRSIDAIVESWLSSQVA